MVRFLVRAMFGLLAAVLPAFGSGLDTWMARPVPVASDLFGVASGAGVITVVGDGGTILVSTNGAHWEIRNSPAEVTLRSVTYGSGMFVAVGDYGTVLTSTNAVNWTQRSSGSTGQLYAVTYASGLFVVAGRVDNNAGYDGVILTSPNGLNWAVRNSGVKEPLYGVAYGNGMWIAVGRLSAVASTNGVTWKNIALANYGDVYSITFGNGQFVAAGNDIYTPRYPFSVSANGDSWRRATANTDGVAWSMAFGSGLFAAAGGMLLSFDNLTNQIALSADGEHWTLHATGLGPEFRGIGYGQGTFVAVGLQGTIVQSGPVSQPTLGVRRRTGDAGLELTVSGEAGSTYLLQGSSPLNPGGWVDLSTITNNPAVIVLPESSVTNSEQQFFRVLTQ